MDSVRLGISGHYLDGSSTGLKMGLPGAYGVIQYLYDQTKQKLGKDKRSTQRFHYGDEIEWLSDMLSFTPAGVYEFLINHGVPLTTIAATFEGLSGGRALAEKYESRPNALSFVTVNEYAMLPKPVPAIRRYLKALAQIGILSTSGDTFYIHYQERPSIGRNISDYQKHTEEGLDQYKE